MIIITHLFRHPAACRWMTPSPQRGEGIFSLFLLFSFLLSAFCFLPCEVFAQKQQKINTQTAEFRNIVTVKPKDVLVVDTKRTKVIFQEWERNEIEFTTTVTMRRATEKDFSRLLMCVNKTHQQLGKKTTYKLRLSDNLNKIDNFEITLLVQMPKDIFINIESSFGDVVMPDVFNDFNADISFGNLNAGNLFGSNNTITIKHGKLKIEQVNHLSLHAQFTQGNLNEVGMLKLNSRFNTIKIDRAKSIALTSAHDNISIKNNIDKIEGAMEFGTLKIGSLKYSCVFTKFSFSKITIDRVLESFTNISFLSSHSTIVLSIPQDQSFAFDYSGSFTKFKDENVRWNYATFEAGNNSLQMSGFYGNTRDSGKSVKITASFGSVSLF
jgi:hypothetical protein